MEYTLTALSPEHLDKLLSQMQLPVDAFSLRMAYLSAGSVSYCLLNGDEPILAGGIVNLMWHRGEAWLLTTPFFRKHLRECYKYVKSTLPRMAREGKFKRVQATCAVIMSTVLFDHLGFEYEGTMKCFGPSGETCHMYARLF